MGQRVMRNKTVDPLFIAKVGEQRLLLNYPMARFKTHASSPKCGV
jgi:hypothetical protein